MLNKDESVQVRLRHCVTDWRQRSRVSCRLVAGLRIESRGWR